MRYFVVGGTVEREVVDSAEHASCDGLRDRGFTEYLSVRDVQVNYTPCGQVPDGNE
jgi:hypothetical protein